MVEKWFCLYIGVFWYKISRYLVPIIHIILFYYPFGVQKLVTVLGQSSPLPVLRIILTAFGLSNLQLTGDYDDLITA